MERKKHGIEIGEFEGFTIYYQKGKKQFVAEARTEDQVIAQIKVHLKRKLM